MLRKRLAMLAAAGVAATGMVLMPATTANAACVGTWSATSTSTATYSGSICSGTQARIDRYTGGNPPVQTYLGVVGNTSSFVSASNGTNSGNYGRWRQGSVWGSWLRVA